MRNNALDTIPQASSVALSRPTGSRAVPASLPVHTPASVVTCALPPGSSGKYNVRFSGYTFGANKSITK